MNLSAKKRAFITGTLLLTGTGFVCRILGFFYRIFLSRTVGAEGLGIYNMVHPIFGICFAVCAGSIQTALSQYVAAHVKRGKAAFCSGLTISMALSGAMAALIWQNSELLATRVLMEPRCAPYLPIMAMSVPFAALHACINGYYYGMQKAHVPAFSQVAEQIIRMVGVFLIADIWLESGREITVKLAMYGHLIGEMASAAFTLFCLGFFPPKPHASLSLLNEGSTDLGDTVRRLMGLAMPLMGNRLVLNLLASVESILIPNCLTVYGLSNSESFAVYGVLTGMALPFILFPSAITNSMAVLLLPTVAEAQSYGNHGRITSTISLSLRYSLYMGILCIGIFCLFGGELGESVFKDPNAGTFISVLAWLCPFLYLATTLGSILNGLGHTSTTFFQNVISLLIRLTFVIFGIPRLGILAYLWGMLASELALSAMHLWALRRLVYFTWDPVNMLVKPAVLLAISIGLYLAFFDLVRLDQRLPLFIATAVHIGFICLCYGGMLLMFHRKYKNA